MTGISFDGLHSYRNFQLILNSYEIGEAKPILRLVEIPGSDGALDYSDYFGGVKYQNRKLKMKFTFLADRFGLNSAYSALQSKLHGKRMKIIFDKDASYYYIGRVSVGALKPDGQIGTVEITAECDPYKYMLTEHESTISGETNPADDINFEAIYISIKNNGNEPLSPTFEADVPYYVAEVVRKQGSVSHIFHGGRYPLPAGTPQMTTIMIEAGQTVEFGLIAETAGTLEVTVRWQERSL